MIAQGGKAAILSNPTITLPISLEQIPFFAVAVPLDNGASNQYGFSKSESTNTAIKFTTGAGMSSSANGVWLCIGL